MSLLASSFAPPIRFLVLVVFGYAAVRTFSLMPSETPDSTPTVFVERGAAPSVQLKPVLLDIPSPYLVRNIEQPTMAVRPVRQSGSSAPMAKKLSQKGHSQIVRAERSPVIPIALKPVDPWTASIANPVGPTVPLASPTTPKMPVKPSTRFFGYGWVLWRGSGSGSTQLPSLGGRQAGLRLDWRWHDVFAVIGRLVTTIGDAPAGGHQREGVIGIAYLPFRDRRIEIAAERRVSLGGGRDAWQLRAAGGQEWTIKGWRLEAYGQVGLTGLRRRDGFAEGQASLRKPIIERGNTRLSLGGGAWGAAQPGVQRLDVGPQVVAEFKLGMPMRLSADYRVRVAGNARPASGPALTLSASF